MKAILFAMVLALGACGPQKKETTAPQVEEPQVEQPKVEAPKVETKLPECYVITERKDTSLWAILNDGCPAHRALEYRLTINGEPTPLKGLYLSKEMHPRDNWKYVDGLKAEYKHEGEWVPAVIK